MENDINQGMSYTQQSVKSYVPQWVRICCAVLNIISGLIGFGCAAVFTLIFYAESGFSELMTESAELFIDRGMSSYDAGMLIGSRDFFTKRVSLFVILCVAGLLIYFGTLIFGMTCAGRSPSGYECGTVERLPYDIYTAAAAGLVTLVGFIYVAVGGTLFTGRYSYDSATQSYTNRLFTYVLPVMIILSLVCASAVLTIIYGFLISTAKRVKCRTLITNTLVFRTVAFVWKLTAAVLGFIWSYIKKIAEAVRFVSEKLTSSWYAAAVMTLYFLANLIISAVIFTGNTFWGLLIGFVFNAACLYLTVRCADSLRTIQRAGEAIAKGEMNYRLDTSEMRGPVKAHAENLNRISEGVAAAVERQMKSERFKTELITNVSHDIKTPITSIVNYVGLLKAEKSDNPKIAEYAEVLERQAKRLKKLTEDVLEASKASSGAIDVQLSRTDIGELVSQCAGEYGERLDGAKLELVCRAEENLYAICDGRLMWRVLDNLLSNVVKYSQSGTRVYLDAEKTDGGVSVTLKNISRTRLNIPGDELMERFVRGDISRSSGETPEGSGLGLSIAESLLELQKASLTISIDGDLFKAVMLLRAA